jgi:MFS family permease
MQTAPSRSLLSLYLAYFADYFSWGAAIAYLAIYISNDQSPFQGILWDRQLALGVAIACFPIGEVLGSPILGDLSDLIGRRKVLLWGLCGSIFSLGVCALGLWEGSFLIFLLGQLLAGFFGGKQGMAQAAIAEIDTGTKGQKLAFLSVLGGIAWITGPYCGNLLLGEPFVLHGGYVWPSLLACGVYGSTLLFAYFFFEDAYQPSTASFSPNKFLRGIGQLFSVAFTGRLFFIFLMNQLGWYLLIVSLSYFLIQKFGLSASHVTGFNSYLALAFTLGGILGTTWILHRFRAKRVLFWTQMVAALGLFSLFGSEKMAELWIYLAIPAITEAILYPAYQTVLSDNTSDQNQGKIFGLIDASNGACQFLAYGILSCFPTDFVGGSILFSALLFLLSAAFIPLVIRRRVAQ